MQTQTQPRLSYYAHAQTIAPPGARELRSVLPVTGEKCWQGVKYYATGLLVSGEGNLSSWDQQLDLMAG